jgi:hypothetical protein
MTRHKHSFFVLLLAAICCVGAARADLIISARTLTPPVGLSGSFDIVLNVTAPTDEVDIGAFSFDILAASPRISFTRAGTMTTVARYIYLGNSFADNNGFPLATKTGQELIASDTPNNGTPAFLFGGEIVSLGDVSYSIAPSAGPIPIVITFLSAGTSLSDTFGNPVAFTAVNGALIPEPAHLTLLAVCLGVFLVTGSPRRAR